MVSSIPDYKDYADRSFLPEKARILLREKFQYSEGLLQTETRNHQMIEAYT
jgi:hypothetical protein